MNQAGVTAAVARCNDEKFLRFSKSKVLEEREMIITASAENDISYAPSETSFAYADLSDLDAELFRQTTVKQDVLIRGIYKAYTRWSRVSTGVVDHVSKYMAALPIALNNLE